MPSGSGCNAVIVLQAYAHVHMGRDCYPLISLDVWHEALAMLMYTSSIGLSIVPPDDARGRRKEQVPQFQD